MPIVIVEDDEVDVEALTRALRRAKLTNPIFVAHDGDAALDILEDQESQPCAVVVDLHMPRVGGLEFLEKLRSHDNDKLSQNIVFLLTAMKRDLERMQASQLGANGYFLKSDLGQIAREISVHCQTGKCAA